ncbi:MAG TPA: elongator complex protein 3 [Thermoproteota archaeon]|nr:elongator complex protein 3 [Thermoproteota archaeon]
MSESNYEQAKKDIAVLLSRSWPVSREEFERIKRSISSEHSLTKVPSNPEILALLDPKLREQARSLLLLKSTRSASGVVVVAVMTSPYPCPHGRCLYCPGGPESNTPQSYTGYEPAARRAIDNRFDPRAQVTQRLRQLEEMGHSTDKVELIVMGGTFLSTPSMYQEHFMSECLNALTRHEPSSLDVAKSRCRLAKRRNVAITVETRPDYCKETHVDAMIEMGVTRVEIGLQSVYPEVLAAIKRGHTVEDSIDAIRFAKDAGLKVCVHIMPGLPGSTSANDIEVFRVLFEDDRFRPDMLKIYPTLVISGTGLEELYRKGLYTPLTNETASEIVADALIIAPRWVRVMRVQRDIPAPQILAGPKHGNLRELAMALLSRRGLSTSEIRSREIGLSGRSDMVESIEMKRTHYSASSGEEMFLEFVGSRTDHVLAYLRLRFPSSRTHRPELARGDSAIVRELKVLGRATPLGKVWNESRQHRGYGVSLMAEAERIAKEEWNLRRLLVISALGTKEYYYRLGYSDDGPYVSKVL